MGDINASLEKAETLDLIAQEHTIRAEELRRDIMLNDLEREILPEHKARALEIFRETVGDLRQVLTKTEFARMRQYLNQKMWRYQYLFALDRLGIENTEKIKRMHAALEQRLERSEGKESKSLRRKFFFEVAGVSPETKVFFGPPLRADARWLPQIDQPGDKTYLASEVARYWTIRMDMTQERDEMAYETFERRANRQREVEVSRLIGRIFSVKRRRLLLESNFPSFLEHRASLAGVDVTAIGTAAMKAYYSSEEHERYHEAKRRRARQDTLYRRNSK